MSYIEKEIKKLNKYLLEKHLKQQVSWFKDKYNFHLLCIEDEALELECLAKKPASKDFLSEYKLIINHLNDLIKGSKFYLRTFRMYEQLKKGV